MEHTTGTTCDPQEIWETAQLEIALEGSNGCSLHRLWRLMKLEEPPVSKEVVANQEKPGDDEGPHPNIFLRQWLWRTIVARRGKELSLTKYSEKGRQWENLARGDPEDSRIAAVEHVDDLKGEEKTIGVVASPQIRLRALGLDTSKLRSISLVSPLYVQVLEVVGRFRGHGATMDEVLEGVNALNKSNKKDEFVEIVTAQSLAGRGPSRSMGDASMRDSGGMVASQFYPVYDRLAKAGLIYKSIVQKPASANPKGKGKHDDILDIMSRFIMLYLSRFQDHILLEEGCRLEPTAREVFMEMVVRHVLEVTGGMGSGAVVPFQSIKQEHSLDKHEASRLKNFLMMEGRIPDSPIKLHMLDLNALTYEAKRGGGRLELCVSLKHSAELEPSPLQRPAGVGLFRSVVGVVKSSPEEGANVDLMRKKLHFGKKCAGKVVDLIVDRPNTYGIWKGYTREGRAAKVQALFYDKNLRGRGNALPGAPSIVKGDVPASYPTLEVDDFANARTLKCDIGGSTGRAEASSSEAPGKVAPGAGELGDQASLDLSDDVELDAFVDTVMDEMDDMFKRAVEARATFEMNHLYPPAGTSEAEKIRWKLMFPVEKRKEFILDELRKCTATTVVKMVNLLRLMEGPGPVLYKGTMDKLIRSLVSEGGVKHVAAPLPQEWAGEPPVRFFGTGEMLVHADAPTDPEAMIGHAKKFREFEGAVAKEIARIKRERYEDERLREEANQSKRMHRLMVYKRKVHRTMILHRELLRCLPKLGIQKEEHRIIDLDRIVLDIPLIMFMTMFGYPPEYLHAKELHRILKIAENEKATVREAPRAIWELMRHNGWFKDALTSSLQVLHDMSVITKIDPANAPSRDDTCTVGKGGSVVDPLAYSHASAKFPLIVRNRTPAKGGDSAIELYDVAVKAVAAERRKENCQGLDGSMFYVSKRGLRKDKKARSAAAQALLQAKDPPAEMKIGLGWACLRTDLAVYAADKTMYKRVSDETQWWDFWNTYQTLGTGQRSDSAGGVEMKLMGTKRHQAEATMPLSQSILAKVPELADPSEWGVDDSCDTSTGKTPWHKSGKMWTQEEDVELLRIVSKAYRDPTSSTPRAGRLGRPSTSMVYREAIRPFAKSVNRSVGACWKRYRKLEDKYGGGPSMLPPTSRHKRLRQKVDSNETKRLKGTRGKRQSGLLARDGPLSIADLDPTREIGIDVNEARKRAREEAAIAKAAGFEWVNEEGSWNEGYPGGGISPRPFNSWNWCLEELAAFTAVRQLLLVPETSFSAGRAMERLKDLRPPTIQKAYRVLMSLSQIDFTEEAWEANTMSVQDCIDHEVYKMIGRHGTHVVRGIVPTRKLRDVILANWSSPLALGGVRSGPGDGFDMYNQLPSGPMSIKDVGANDDKLSAVLKAVARGRACFTVSPGDFNAEEGGAATNQLGGGGTGGKTAASGGDQLAMGSSTAASEVVGEGTTNSIGGGGLTAKYCPVAFKYRTTRIIDSVIMAAAAAEVVPVEAADCGSGVQGSRDGAGSSLSWCGDVRGPEMDWGSSSNGCGDDKLALLLKALEGGKEDGLTLWQLRREVQCLQGVDVWDEPEEMELSALGRALRSGAAVCACGSENVKYIHRKYLQPWLVPAVNGVESQPARVATPSHSRPILMEVAGEAVEDKDDVEMEGAATLRLLKGMGRWDHEAREVGGQPVVWLPWMTFDGHVDLRLLSRIRQGLVAYIRKHPGCTAGEVRREEFPYLSGGEVMLLLKDLVRRKVLFEDTVPDTRKVTIGSGWGLACQNSTWAIENLCTEDGGESRTAFLTAPEWVDAIQRVVPAEHM